MKIGSVQINVQRILLIFGLALLVFLLMDFNNRLTDLNSKQEKLHSISGQATQVMQTQIALKTAVAYATSDSAVEQWAREQAHLSQLGDHVVLPLAAPGTTPIVQATPTPTATPYTMWDVWMELLFGK